MRTSKAKSSPRKAQRCEHEALIQALRERIHTLELERDEARHGLVLLEDALRRQGCCEPAPEPQNLEPRT